MNQTSLTQLGYMSYMRTELRKEQTSIQYSKNRKMVTLFYLQSKSHLCGSNGCLAQTTIDQRATKCFAFMKPDPV